MQTADEYECSVATSLDDVDEDEWQRLAGANPFVSYKFLTLMQSSGCAVASKGWLPQYLLVRRGGRLVGASACYVKSHSRGEFVFDQGWAEAFERHGISYYPKLLVAAPFTPVQGPRLLALDTTTRDVLAAALVAFAQSLKMSSLHVLFLENEDRRALKEAGFLIREGVQFHWHNDGYSSLEDFLAQLSHDKRKKIRQDSKYVAQAGIKFSSLTGSAIDEEHIEFFYSCYVKTYRAHWSEPYLSLEFFKEAHRIRALDLVLTLAMRGDEPVGCALNVRSGSALYGRYWGATEFVRGLHFETCYVQSIAFCIEHGIEFFEGGAQGEHKMARGLLPSKTYSAHWVSDRNFYKAIEEFLQRETQAVEGYVEQLQAGTPFKAAR